MRIDGESGGDILDLWHCGGHFSASSAADSGFHNGCPDCRDQQQMEAEESDFHCADNWFCVRDYDWKYAYERHGRE